VLSIQLTGFGDSGDVYHRPDICAVIEAYDSVNGRFKYKVYHHGGDKITGMFFTVVGKK